MLPKLRKHLIILNTLITSLILTIVILYTYHINLTQLKKHNLLNFSNLKDDITYQLTTNNMINNTWLSQIEATNHLIIHIEDNKIPYLFKGSWTPPTPREIMIKKALNVAKKEEIDPSNYTISSFKNNSSIFKLSGNQKEPYFATVCIIPNNTGYMSLTLIQYQPNKLTKLFLYTLLYLTADLLGILALFLVSCFFVKKALKPIEENQVRQNEFIASASHDLRSPLAVIQSNASALLIEGSDTKRFVPKIIDECTRMSRLISDMLILASSDAKTWQIQKEIIDTETYLIDIYDSFSSLSKKYDHPLSLDLPDDSLPPINVDKDRLTQVISILIDNAISYSKAKAPIILRPYVKKSFFSIEIEDHGIGIQKEERDLIFHRFYRTDKSRNDNTHFGLGLSVAKELTELQSGRICVKDTIGGGTTFIIELPLK